jgi:hypothetical protein
MNICSVWNSGHTFATDYSHFNIVITLHSSIDYTDVNPTLGFKNVIRTEISLNIYTWKQTVFLFLTPTWMKKKFIQNLMLAKTKL